MGNSKYAGTETEKNLRNAFSGESEARNKYSYFASVAKKEGYRQLLHYSRKQRIMKKNMQKCGLKSYRELEIQKRTLKQQQKGKIMNGQICMPDLLKQQRKKVFRNWLQNSAL